MLRLILLCIALSLMFSSCSEVDSLILDSPDGYIRMMLYVDEESALKYDLLYRDSIILKAGSLGLEEARLGKLGAAVKIASFELTSRDETWSPVYGERSRIRDHFKGVKISLYNVENGEHEMNLDVRAYNEGIAFRYEVPFRGDYRIIKEISSFPFTHEVYGWASRHAQGPISKVKLSSINEASERPLLVEVTKDTYAALGEAALVDYARMKFIADVQRDHCLLSVFFSEVQGSGTLLTPWRFVMLGASPAEILENNDFILNLNAPKQIDDPSWIRPGKVIREVTLTTTGGKACVDFAEKYDLQYVEFDAGWYGNEYEDTSDATTVTVDPNRSPGPLDLQEVIDYAHSRDIGIILYVNRRALEKQLDEILPLLKSWGVAGLKYGFVNVGSQQWTSWLHEAVRKAAAHELMVDIHDEYRPTGYSRTYPNLMTQEGIRGDEESPPNEMVINTLFTRMIAGAGDHTNCYFADRVHKTMGSHASQMAKVICIYSPWQFLFWYDRPMGSPGKKGGAGGAEGSIPEIQDLEFYRQLPTVWEDTRVLDGYPGSHALIARRSGDRWFVGALNGTEEREFTFTLDFLEEGVDYSAEIYSDDASLETRTKVRMESLDVNSETEVLRRILKRNGFAMIISPVKNKKGEP